MRSLPALCSSVLPGLRLPRRSSAQRSDDQIAPKSVDLQRQGKALLGAGKLEQAEDALETALAVDPRNRWAFVDSPASPRSSICSARRSA